MGEKMKNELKSEELEKVSGGTPPELTATQLSGSGYEGMFAPCEPLDPLSTPTLEAMPLAPGNYERLSPVPPEDDLPTP